MSMNCLLAQPAAKGVRSGADDLDVQHPAEQIGAAIEVDDPELRGASGDPAVLDNRVHEDPLPASEEPCVALGLEALLPTVQDMEPAALLRLRHVVLQAQSGGARPRRVGED